MCVYMYMYMYVPICSLKSNATRDLKSRVAEKCKLTRWNIHCKARFIDENVGINMYMYNNVMWEHVLVSLIGCTHMYFYQFHVHVQVGGLLFCRCTENPERRKSWNSWNM